MSFAEGGIVSLPVNAGRLDRALRCVTPPRDLPDDGPIWERVGMTREAWEAAEAMADKEEQKIPKNDAELRFIKMPKADQIAWEDMRKLIAEHGEGQELLVAMDRLKAERRLAMEAAGETEEEDPPANSTVTDVDPLAWMQNYETPRVRPAWESESMSDRGARFNAHGFNLQEEPYVSENWKPRMTSPTSEPRNIKTLSQPEHLDGLRLTEVQYPDTAPQRKHNPNHHVVCGACGNELKLNLHVTLGLDSASPTHIRSGPAASRRAGRDIPGADNEPQPWTSPAWSALLALTTLSTASALVATTLAVTLYFRTGVSRP